MNAVETERLTKRFRRVRSFGDLLRYRWRPPDYPAVEDVTLTIPRGEMFGLLGENGAGKSTLIRMLSTTLLPTSGRAVVGGHDVVARPHAVRRLIGLVSGDERSFFWRLTGRQNLRYFAALYHVPRPVAQRRIDDLLETLGVASYADHRYAALSTGTRQKFAIVRGMLTEPEILFLDEPTRTLDPLAAEDLRGHITRHIIGDLHRTVILATHSLVEAEAMCDRVAILRAGRIVDIGTVAELSERRHLADVLDVEVGTAPAALLASIEALPGVLDLTCTERIDGAQVRLEVRMRAGTDNVADVLQAISTADVAVGSVTTRRPTLSDVYRDTYAAD